MLICTLLLFVLILQKKIAVDLSVAAIDAKSAFATYICKNKDCYTGGSEEGWYEDSGTSFNHIAIDNLRPSLLYFIVYGRGLFKNWNNYTINIDVRSHD